MGPGDSKGLSLHGGSRGLSYGERRPGDLWVRHGDWPAGSRGWTEEGRAWREGYKAGLSPADLQVMAKPACTRKTAAQKTAWRYTPRNAIH